MEHKRLRVTVVDMQPITPAVGGGRQRLLGLYHALGPDIDCTYVGTYDWPGESCRDQQITPGLREIVVPLSDEHHAAAAALSKEVGGRTVIDIAFCDQVHLSPDFLRVAREHIAGADVVVFSHPWCFPPLADVLRDDQLIVYDSQNVEAVLRTSLHDDLPEAAPLLDRVAAVEYALSRRADLILSCSQEDSDLYVRTMEVDPFKLRIVPNGAFVERFRDDDTYDRIIRRRELGLPVDQPVAVFLGSMYGPNVEATRFIAQTLAPACPSWCFVLVGGAGESLEPESIACNVIITGRVNDARRDKLLLTADLALNPMAAGSGTNIKMFDYMAAGLPVLTTEVGARGICTETSAPSGVFVEPLEQHPTRCAELLASLPFDPRFKDSVRDFVRQRFSWEQISGALGVLFKQAAAGHGNHLRHKIRVAMFSTWNVTCGIGDHSVHLAEGLIEAGADVVILGNRMDDHQSIGFENDLHFPVLRVWHWDNTHWRDSVVDRLGLDAALRLSKPNVLILQHHTAFIPFDNVLGVVRAARDLGVRVVLEMHNARHVSAEQKTLLCEAGASLIAHHAGGLDGLPEAYVNDSRVLPLPIYIPRNVNNVTTTYVRKTDFSNHTIIGGFGFLRRYKGVLTAIRTLALLRNKYPSLMYHGWHSHYAGGHSDEYLRECLREAEQLGVRDAVEIETRFLPIDEIIANLRSVDAVLMPYEPSEEGASAAANMALAAGRPLITSCSSIFLPLANVAWVLDRHAPDAYAAAIDHMLSQPELMENMRNRAAAWATEHSYRLAAETLLRAPNPASPICANAT